MNKKNVFVFFSLALLINPNVVSAKKLYNEGLEAIANDYTQRCPKPVYQETYKIPKEIALVKDETCIFDRKNKLFFEKNKDKTLDFFVDTEKNTCVITFGRWDATFSPILDYPYNIDGLHRFEFEQEYKDADLLEINHIMPWDEIIKKLGCTPLAENVFNSIHNVELVEKEYQKEKGEFLCITPSICKKQFKTCIMLPKYFPELRNEKVFDCTNIGELFLFWMGKLNKQAGAELDIWYKGEREQFLKDCGSYCDRYKKYLQENDRQFSSF